MSDTSNQTIIMHPDDMDQLLLELDQCSPDQAVVVCGIPVQAKAIPGSDSAVTDIDVPIYVSRYAPRGKPYLVPSLTRKAVP